MGSVYVKEEPGTEWYGPIPSLEDLSALSQRVDQFNSLALPGQPMSMHMGTSYLVNELWSTIGKIVGRVNA